MIRWKIPSASIRGKAHATQNVCGEDSRGIKLDGHNAAVVLTDGAGSASHAFHGSKAIADALSSFLVKNVDKALNYSDEAVRAIILRIVEAELETLKAQYPGTQAEDFSTTAAGWISDGERFVAFNVGDGIIGRVSAKNEAETLLGQERGEFANSSFFITDSGAVRHLRIARGDVQSGDVFFLMTDGSAECLYDQIKGLYAPALHTMAEWTRRYTRESVNEGLLDVMQRLFSRRTSDDCALAFAYRQV